MDRDEMLNKLENGTYTARWAAREIKALESHAENLATACNFAIGALPNNSFIASEAVKVVKNYNNRRV